MKRKLIYVMVIVGLLTGCSANNDTVTNGENNNTIIEENIEEEKSEDIINFCTTIVSNEFHNKNKNIFLQYMSARKILKDNWVKSTIEKQKKYMNKIEYFCIKNNLYLMYKFIIKIIERK